METNNNNDSEQANALVAETETPQRNPFILGNTKEIGMEELGDMLTPVFSRDNVESISHIEGISTLMDSVSTFFDGEDISSPLIRVSHEMKVKKGQSNSDSYFQRMMAMIEIPSITHNINGSQCNLQVCLVRNYADCNLLGNSSQKQCWKACIGLVNTVCTNMLCRSYDGCNLSIKVTNTADLYRSFMELFQRYDYKQHIDEMRRLNDVMIDVPTLAQFLGRAKMASYLPTSKKAELGLPEFILPEAQLNQMVRDYYTDESFGGFGQEISMWQFYMLLTSYKNNYIDVSLERSANAYTISNGIAAAINHEDDAWNWFIS